MRHPPMQLQFDDVTFEEPDGLGMVWVACTYAPKVRKSLNLPIQYVKSNDTYLN